MSRARIAVYGDVDLNIVDGSAVWLTSVVEVLARRSDVDVDVLLKTELTRDLLTQRLSDLANVSLVRPGDRLPSRLSPSDAVSILEQLDSARPFDIVFLRGFALCERAAGSERLRGRLWCYLTDIPQRVHDLDDDSAAAIRAIADASDALVCQTEELRSFIEAVVPDRADRTVLLPPMVPAGRRRITPPAQTTRIV